MNFTYNYDRTENIGFDQNTLIIVIDENSYNNVLGQNIFLYENSSENSSFFK